MRHLKRRISLSQTFVVLKDYSANCPDLRRRTTVKHDISSVEPNRETRIS